MSSHTNVFTSLTTGARGKIVSLVLAGLIVLSGQGTAHAKTATPAPEPISSTAPAEPRSDFLITFAADTTEAQRRDALAAADAVSLSEVPALRLYSASLTTAGADTLRADAAVAAVE